MWVSDGSRRILQERESNLSPVDLLTSGALRPESRKEYKVQEDSRLRFNKSSEAKSDQACKRQSMQLKGFSLPFGASIKLL